MHTLWVGDLLDYGGERAIYLGPSLTFPGTWTLLVCDAATGTSQVGLTSHPEWWSVIARFREAEDG